MTPVILVGLMVIIALIVSITWIEPRLLGGAAGGPAGSGQAQDPVAAPRALQAVDPQPQAEGQATRAA